MDRGTYESGNPIVNNKTLPISNTSSSYIQVALTKGQPLWHENLSSLSCEGQQQLHTFGLLED